MQRNICFFATGPLATQNCMHGLLSGRLLILLRLAEHAAERERERVIDDDDDTRVTSIDPLGQLPDPQDNFDG
jgi:hypothetical protein